MSAQGALFLLCHNVASLGITSLQGIKSKALLLSFKLGGLALHAAVGQQEVLRCQLMPKRPCFPIRVTATLTSTWHLILASSRGGSGAQAGLETDAGPASPAVPGATLLFKHVLSVFVHQSDREQGFHASVS